MVEKTTINLFPPFFHKVDPLRTLELRVHQDQQPNLEKSYVTPRENSLHFRKTHWKKWIEEQPDEFREGMNIENAAILLANVNQTIRELYLHDRKKFSPPKIGIGEPIKDDFSETMWVDFSTKNGGVLNWIFINRGFLAGLSNKDLYSYEPIIVNNVTMFFGTTIQLVKTGTVEEYDHISFSKSHADYIPKTAEGIRGEQRVYAYHATDLEFSGLLRRQTYVKTHPGSFDSTMPHILQALVLKTKQYREAHPEVR